MKETSLVPDTETRLQTVEEAASRETMLPRTDIRETPEAFLLVADLPGVTEESLDISLEKGQLSVHGRRTRGEPGEGYSLRWGEVQDRDFYRSFRLPEDIDAEKIDATLAQGVLRLRLPKSQTVTRRIEVKTGI